ncbi:MAG: hypothetical protein WKF96_19465 [Solirubrobacteraceae bacterium]
MSSDHLQRLAAMAAPLLERCLASDEFEQALHNHLRAAAIGLAAGAGADHFEIGRACAESEDGGAAMADALLGDLTEAERDEITTALGADLAHRVQVAAIAYVAGRLEATFDAQATLDDVDVDTIVHTGIGLGSVAS